jgi:hypothetical protein
MISHGSVDYKCRHQYDDGGEQENTESIEHQFCPIPKVA